MLTNDRCGTCPGKRFCSRFSPSKQLNSGMPSPVSLSTYRNCSLVLYARRITVGYHRLYSHRAFRASWPVRIVLAALGSMGFQGSIKVFGSLLMLLASTFFSPKICSCSSLWAWAYVPHSGGECLKFLPRHPASVLSLDT